MLGAAPRHLRGCGRAGAHVVAAINVAACEVVDAPHGGEHAGDDPEERGVVDAQDLAGAVAVEAVVNLRAGGGRGSVGGVGSITRCSRLPAAVLPILRHCEQPASAPLPGTTHQRKGGVGREQGWQGHRRSCCLLRKVLLLGAAHHGADCGRQDREKLCRPDGGGGGARCPPSLVAAAPASCAGQSTRYIDITPLQQRASPPGAAAAHQPGCGWPGALQQGHGAWHSTVSVLQGAVGPQAALEGTIAAICDTHWPAPRG